MNRVGGDSSERILKNRQNRKNRNIQIKIAGFLLVLEKSPSAHFRVSWDDTRPPRISWNLVKRAAGGSRLKFSRGRHFAILQRASFKFCVHINFHQDECACQIW